ncbi:hypothetical protein GCM10010140_54470 [Streptosporangium pseudovulgare]|uniref:Uncharacterized protein n=1 Tax=Streptosporangium pseudovulgare TaxID=35765 RepID=A0ABQ2R773_9ACTN|nr:hypothetical protein GCM10010140_54470 [Streptosporangium pseudovulgare]
MTGACRCCTTGAGSGGSSPTPDPVRRSGGEVSPSKVSGGAVTGRPGRRPPDWGGPRPVAVIPGRGRAVSVDPSPGPGRHPGPGPLPPVPAPVPLPRLVL